MKQTSHQPLYEIADHIDFSDDHLAFFCGNARFVLHTDGRIELKNHHGHLTMSSLGKINIHGSHLQQKSKTDILMQSGKNIHLNSDKELEG